MRVFVFIFLCLSFLVTKAQVEVVADGRLQNILEQHVLYNEMARTSPGYRIRLGIFTGQGSKAQAFALRDELMIAYPNVRAYVFFDEPNFIVKCGDYLTKLDAYSIYTKMKLDYPSATLIRDYINPPVLSSDDLVLPEYYEENTESTDF